MTTSPSDQNEQLKKAVFAIKKLQSKLEGYQARENERACVIGMACRLPGKSSTLTSYWNLLTKGEYAIGHIPEDRWDIKKYYDKDAHTPGKYSSLYGSFLDDVKGFDNEFFGISDAEAAAMDPHQRIVLMVTWEALQNAYIPPSEVMGKNIGVFLGMGSDKCDYMSKHAEHLDLISSYTGLGNTLNGASGRISYVLNSQGPSETVDTACSSSLVALHQATQSLLSHECDIAVVGGVSLMLSPLVDIICTKMGVLSPDGHTRGFDRECAGFGRGEGCGVVILKRLSDAQQNQDKILAVIRGTAMNHNGMTMSLSAPSQLAQEAVMKRTLVSAAIEPNEVSYIEAHATASKIGDSLELEAIKKVYGEKRTQNCYLASAKSHFGHLDAASGIAGLIKTILQLNHKKITRQLDFKALNENVQLSNTKFHVPTEVIDWNIEEGKSRLAAVSAYGWTGQNGHVILEESNPQGASCAMQEKPYLLPLSAKTIEYFTDLLSLYEKYLPEHAAELGEIAKLASNGREHYKVRHAFLANTLQELLEQIAREKALPSQPIKSPARLVFDFPDVDYSVSGLTLDQEFIELIKQKTGVDTTVECLVDPKAQMVCNFAARYTLAALWTRWVGKPDEIHLNQTSESGEMAYFGEKSVDDMLDELKNNGKVALAKGSKIGAITVGDPAKADSNQVVIDMSKKFLQESSKKILQELYNLGRKINWSTIYPSKEYAGILELPTHPFHLKSFWIS